MTSQENNYTNKKSKINQLINNGWFILGCNACSIIGLIITFLNDNSICKVIFAAITGIMICSIVFYMFYRVFNLKRATRNIHKINLAINKKTFLYLHAFYQDLLSYISLIQKNENISKVTFHDKAALLCNRIEKIFTVCLGTKDPVSVCIKLIKADTIFDNDFLNSQVYTFARSSSTSPMREKYDLSDNPPDKIINNSDFEMIVSDERIFKKIDYFACEDLDSYPDIYKNDFKKDYQNSHFSPPYKSAIVIPIRTKIENISKNLKNRCIDTNCYHIVGFLCIDSEEKFLPSEDYRYTRFTNSIELAYTLGEALYPFLEENLIKSL